MSLMQFAFWKYNLKPKAQIGMMADGAVREGALFQVRWPDGLEGYADCFPWPEMGDLSLDEQILSLKSGRLTRLLEQTLWFAHRDAVARSKGLNLLKSQIRVRNHLLLRNSDNVSDNELVEVKRSGYQSVKLKCGKNADADIELCIRLVKVHGLNVRLDFNSKSTPAELEHFVKSIPSGLRGKLEYVEDPFPFDQDTWAKMNEIVPLALDLEEDRVDWEKLPAQAPFKVLILKPSRQDIGNMVKRVHKHRIRFVITSSLDHPVGLLHAAALSNEYKRLYPNTILDGGCFSHHHYEADAFSQLLPTKGPFFAELPGNGIGFDELFKSLPWMKLSDI